MKLYVISAVIAIALSTSSLAADRSIEMSTDIEQVLIGEQVNFQCVGVGDWKRRLQSATVEIRNAQNDVILNETEMAITGVIANFSYFIPTDVEAGEWVFTCMLSDRKAALAATATFSVIDPVADDPQPDPPSDGGWVEGPIPAHNTIVEYNGPLTCITCHQEEAAEMLDSLHMKWSGPTPNLTNTNGEELGKAVGGINSFCTYAVSSKGACYSCHVRADGNAPHPPEAKDVDCLMCHSDTYQRKFVPDSNNTETVTNIYGETKTYVFGKVDELGNYLTIPDYDKMPAGTDMVNVARTVHVPTSKSCLRCHAKAGGGDWTKRGDMGLSSADPGIDEDFHLSKDGANLSCVNCHADQKHKIAGRGIDLRQTETSTTSCQECHTKSPHQNATLNRHAEGQVSCQVCHIREYAKGGATELSRDWRIPVWNPAFCSGQGGFVGEEIKAANQKPEYVWFDGTSYVYNIGEKITLDERGFLAMAKAHGSPFDGNSSIVPIKRHFSIMPLHESGEIVPPSIMWMFMTGDFDLAVQKGMEEQGMTGNYSLVEADAEMLITHGVDSKDKAPSCTECHNGTGNTPDGYGILPFDELGYHQTPETVKSCTLCHSQKSLQWENMHQKHRQLSISCTSCHTSEPTGFVKPQNTLCSSCHENKSWRYDEGHKKHFEKGLTCSSCHTFT
ncbi:hypothetical protein [Desulfopila sp. IMCC35008]|uniref:hypothetical protein n=1 Tax=Desulfopila sp. IMCC35008 TaxID=2653858 RepID=UPI0013D75400|nr:hypothetical protein [Desulfopila sp. IMCC35008]